MALSTSLQKPPKSWRRVKRSLNQTWLNALLLIISFIFLFPMIVVVSASFSDETALAKEGYGLLPRQFSTLAYDFILKDPTRILRAYGVTIFVTTVGTLAGLLVMALLAYSISRHEFSLRKPLSFLVVFTMLFNGGLVPTYYIITQVLHLKDTLAVLILPYMVIPWFVFLLRAFFSTLPSELIEAARVDGASEFRIFFQIVIPLSTPVLATVGLFMILQYWNDWWLPLLYITDSKLFPLQYLLYSVMRNVEFLTSNNSTASGLLQGIAMPTQTLRMALVVVAMGPIMIVFITLQRYFTRGILLGSIKG